MDASPLVEIETLAAWLGLEFAPGSLEQQRAGTVIQVISGFARSEAAQPGWTLSNVPEDVAAVVLLTAVRSWSNPDGKSSVTMDDVTRRWERGSLFDESELRTLRRHRKGSGGLSSISFSTVSQSVAKYTDVEGGSPLRMFDGRGY